MYLLVVDCYSKWPSVVKLADSRSSTVIGHLEKMFCDFGIPQTLLSDNEAQYGSSEFRDFAKRMHMQHTTSSPRYLQSNGMAERVAQTFKRSLTKMLTDGKSLLQTLTAVRSTPIGDGLPSPAVGKWQSAIIRRHDQTPQSYWLEMGSESVLRRNRNQINTTARDRATPAKDNSNDISGERACPDTTQSSSSMEEPTLCHSERASGRPKFHLGRHYASNFATTGFIFSASVGGSY